ncbi:MAG: tRNA (N6-threonylcarbamoyladenosine(37)-N6)-methyltransferase TrmO [Pseudobdellovibrionaceae bacterium]
MPRVMWKLFKRGDSTPTMKITFEPIGILESCYIDKFGTPRQPGLVAEATARLKIRSDLQPEQALEGLEGFSYVWLIWVFHKNSNARYHAKVHPPRYDGNAIGTFATRSPHRPNPIGLSLVQLIKIEKDTLILGGVDLTDGTPILDIKPYLPEIESKPDAREGWTNKAKKPNLQIHLSETAEQTLQKWIEKSGRKELKDLILHTIRLDPRPLVYRGDPDESPYRTNHAMRIFEGDVHFKFISENEVQITAILLP